jgi:cytochrome c biogenesis protein CcmG/thiol:disulfide interchange protein DsbE
VSTLPQTPSRGRRVVVLVPLAVFLALTALFLVRLFSGDPSRIPSALIGHPAPAVDLPPVAGLERDGKPIPGISAADFRGNVTVLNVWASWCIPCHDEAPFLLELAGDTRIRLVGINYKDQPDNARRFLNRYGNPFAASGADQTGRRRSNGASTVYPRPLSSAVTAASPTSSSAPSGRRISNVR